MAPPGSPDVATESLLERADLAVRESQRLVSSLKTQRARAQHHMDHLHRIEEDFQRPTPILYPSDITRGATLRPRIWR